ncbi:cation transport protein [Marinobacter santoriniensis NKSG1]|uniref:Cation transport protein n=1 Tax=Marinobacter santoriniensis NKSG1 TaxID=1288826 RepID=M7CLS3_9GAMM|nr:potassium transporter TrkG [Marinobacter santoriniensis]EMP54586.1 cation transport protein [Marinobacter santoriniensis NKSG1]
MRLQTRDLLPISPRAGRMGPKRISPPGLLIEGFCILIVLGTCLLKLPWATEIPVTWLEAAFTATSAVTVTGLTVVDTATEYTLFGQIVILLLIQLGGLGLMTFAVLTAMALGFKLGLRHHLAAQEAFNEITLSTTKSAGTSIAIFALSAEAIGLVILAFYFVPEKGWADGLYQALFYSVSAFNNAGFALSPDSLSAYVDNAGVTLTVTGLFIIGGLGYLVAREVFENRGFSGLSMFSRLILTSTLVINLAAMALFLLLEYGNPGTLGALDSVGDKLLAAWFQATTTRTAGFNSVDIGALTAGTSVLFLLLMFIGGAPNSTASGIKLSTFLVLLSATRAFLKGNLTATMGRHSLSRETVLKALAVTTLAMVVIFLGVLGLSISVQGDFLDIAFEVVSAFGTVGLSRGITSELGAPGQLIIMVIMLVGRVGPLTLGYMLTMRRKSLIRYATTEIPVG